MVLNLKKWSFNLVALLALIQKEIPMKLELEFKCSKIVEIA